MGLQNTLIMISPILQGFGFQYLDFHNFHAIKLNYIHTVKDVLVTCDGKSAKFS